MNVDGSEATGKAKKNYELDEDKLFSSGIMDKQTLTSTKVVGDTSRYAVGILGSILIDFLNSFTLRQRGESLSLIHI